MSGHFILKTVAANAKNLAHQIDLFFLDCQSSHLVPSDNSSFPGYIKHRIDTKMSGFEDEIIKAHRELTCLCDTIAIEIARNNPKDNLAILVKKVGSVFHGIVKIMLGVQINLCLDGLHGEDVEKSLSCLTALAVDGHNLCRLLVRHGAVSVLVQILQADHVGQDVRIYAMKGLGSICYVSEGIKKLAETNGLDVIVDILENESLKEEERREAAGVIAQVTSPWIEGNLCKEKIGRHLERIIHSLKGNFEN